MSADTNATPLFSDLQLSSPLLKALEDAGYESPTPIQSRMIPHMLAGRDVVGQAQTGTGKTAAFALPLLMHLKAEKPVHPQILVLAPTRELALQVSDSFQQYGRHLDNFRSLAIFGGQDYGVQLSALKRGVQVIVGTPGRVMDHIRRGSLNLQHIHSLVLDEADEMLKMGFIDDVEWILEQTPATRQIALFSATMPQSIRRTRPETSVVAGRNSPSRPKPSPPRRSTSAISRPTAMPKNSKRCSACSRSSHSTPC